MNSKSSKLPTYTALQSQHKCSSQHKEHPAAALTLPQGQRGGWSCIPSPPAPPPGHRLETPPAPAWARHLHCAAETSGTHPSPPAHPLHMTEAIKMTRTYDQKTSDHKISSLIVWTPGIMKTPQLHSYKYQIVSNNAIEEPFGVSQRTFSTQLFLVKIPFKEAFSTIKNLL